MSLPPPTARHSPTCPRCQRGQTHSRYQRGPTPPRRRRDQARPCHQHGQVSPRHQRGQVIVEYILLMVVLIGVFSSIMNILKGNDLATRFTTGPWEKMNGMIQCGNWVGCGVNQPAPGVHPNTQNRVLTLDPRRM